MNYTEFIKKVDQASRNMPPENMAAFLHDYARSVPEHRREEFLGRLLVFGNRRLQEDYVKKQDVLDLEGLKSEIAETMELLDQIDNGEIMLLEILNEEYDDWYGEGEEFFYEDPENICEVISNGIKLVHECVDRELYQECYDLADFLLAMEITADGEYDGRVFSLQELKIYGILVFNYEEFVLEALLAAYWGKGLNERPEAIYWMLENSSSRNVTLELLMSKSRKELDQFQEFLGLWIAYLGERNGKVAEKFLPEAVSLSEDPDILLETARKYTALHPKLYVQALKEYQAKGQTEKGMEIGLEALAQITSDQQVRSQAALLTAEFALQRRNQETAEKCWLEAFRSAPSVVNYLRLALETEDFGRWQKEASGICMDFRPKEESYNRISVHSEGNAYYALLFFDGKIRQMITEGMGEKKALGWSFTFMKEGLALLFLYLYKGESLPAGCSQMCASYVQAISFDRETYLQGTVSGTELDNRQFFWDRFCKWKETVEISEEEAQDIIGKLEEWVKLRVAGIMEKNRRNYYGECAAFVAALGEVKESRGEMGSKARTMEEFRSEYSRRSAFHQELRAFGMKDTRKRK